MDPFCGGGGGRELRRGCFSVKMYVKTKDLDPVGGRVPENFVCRSANGNGKKMVTTHMLHFAITLQTLTNQNYGVFFKFHNTQGIYSCPDLINLKDNSYYWQI